MNRASKQQLAGDIYLVQSNEDVTFGNEHLELSFSKSDGQLHWIRDAKTHDIVASSGERDTSIELWEGGELDASKMPYDNYRFDDVVNQRRWRGITRYLGHDVLRTMDAVEFHVMFGDERWRVEQILSLRPSDPIVRIEWVLRYMGKAETKLREVVISLPKVEDWATRVELPKAAVAPNLPMEEFDGQISFSTIAGVHDVADSRSLFCWIYDEHSATNGVAHKLDQTIQWNYTYFNGGVFKPGTVLKFGRNHIAFQHGSWADCMSTFHNWHAEMGFLKSEEGCSWARSATIWEAHVGTISFAPDYDYAPYPTLTNFQEDLPRIKDLGFNTLQIMPKMPLPGYCVYHYENLSETYGGGNDREFKEFIAEAKKLGFRIILDVVLHGVVDGESGRKGDDRYTIRNRFFKYWADHAEPVHKYRREHPDWFRISETGEIDYIHTWMFEFMNRELVDFIIEHLRRCLTEFDVDGFRFDCPEWGSSPNWSKDYPYWPSRSRKAVVHALRKAKKELNSVKPDILWYTEPSHSEYGAFMDMTYAYEEDWLPEALCPVVTARGFHPTGHLSSVKTQSADVVCQWLEQRRTALPNRNMVIQHHLDSHDTWWQNEKAMFRNEAFGPEAARALTAFMALLDGAFMTFVGAERGQEEFYKNLLKTRQSIPALRQGECDYTRIKSDSGKVMALWRETQGKWAVPVINFSNKTVDCRIAMSQSIIREESRALIDHFTGCVIMGHFDAENFVEGLKLSLKPWQVMVLAPES